MRVPIVVSSTFLRTPCAVAISPKTQNAYAPLPQYPIAYGYCAGMVIRGNGCLDPVSARAKRYIKNAKFRFALMSRSSIQNQ